VSEGQIIQQDGVYLTPEGAKKMAEIVKERDALRRELANYPDSWQRIWTAGAVFFVGVGTGVWLVP